MAGFLSHHYRPLWPELAAEGGHDWASQLPEKIAHALTPSQHGRLGQWLTLLDALPENLATKQDYRQDKVMIGAPADLNPEQRLEFLAALNTFKPWRKGPYRLFGIDLDTEWRSDWKWHRLINHIQPLRNRRVLDVGCGNGYHGWRMLAAGARLVVGT